MGKRVLLLSLSFFIVGWATAPPGAEAISCISVTNVTLLGPTGCDLGGLTFNNFTDQTERDEQKGLMFLLSGVVSALRNPRAHKLLQDEPSRALECIALLSLLAGRVEKATPRTDT